MPETPANPPAPELRSAAPPLRSRLLAFAAVLIGGASGALIGYGFTDLQCEGSCATWLGAGTLIGAVIGAGGVAVVAVLALRAMDEWKAARAKTPRRHSRS